MAAVALKLHAFQWQVPGRQPRRPMRHMAMSSDSSGPAGRLAAALCLVQVSSSLLLLFKPPLDSVHTLVHSSCMLHDLPAVGTLICSRGKSSKDRRIAHVPQQLCCAMLAGIQGQCFQQIQTGAILQDNPLQPQAKIAPRILSWISSREVL